MGAWRWAAAMLAAWAALAGEVELYPSASALSAWQASGEATVTVVEYAGGPSLLASAIGAQGELVADTPDPHWQSRGALVVRWSAPAANTAPIGIEGFLTDQDTERFPLGGEMPPLAPGETRDVRLDLVNGPEAAGSYRFHYVRQLGFVLRAGAPGQALYLDGLRLIDAPPRPTPLKPALLELPALAMPAARGRPAEVRFRFTPALANPYQPEPAVTARLRAPSGQVLERPCFFSREYRLAAVDGKEVVTVAGDTYWALRFTPAEAGAHECRLHVGGEALGEPFAIAVAPAAGPVRGFVRLPANDRGSFEFEDGTPFFPMGVNFCWPWDSMYGAMPTGSFPAGRELSVYRDYFEELAAAGGNCTQIWMTPFWTAIQWSALHDGYGGLGWYNTEAAWKLDYVLDAARERGIRVLLTVLNHHQFFADKGNRSQWEGNPWNEANGGPLANRTDFLSDPAARRAYAGMLRYILARWGHDPAILSFNLVSELDNLAHGANDESAVVQDTQGAVAAELAPEAVAARAWLEEMHGVAATIQPVRPLLTAGNCQEGRTVAHQNYQSPLMPVVMTDAYTHGSWTPAENVHAMVHNTFKSLDRYGGRPVLLTEIGYHNSGDTGPEAAVGLHCAAWTGTMMPYCGGPLYWWWNVVHGERLYGLLKPVAAFWQDEDRRGQNFQHRCMLGPQQAEAGQPGPRGFGTPSEGFWAYGLQGRTRFYAILFPRAEARYFMENPPPIRGATWGVNPQLPGPVVCEWWDPGSGEIVGRSVQPDGQQKFTLAVPDFTCDLAIKIWTVDDPARVEPVPLRQLPDPPSARTTLTVESRLLAKRDVPRDEAAARALIEDGGIVLGKGAWPRLDVRINPFGRNDHFLAIYEGELRCPAEGEYTFAVNSDDASFLWIDDRPVAEWPGEHGPDKNNYGIANTWEHRGQVRLTAGAHRLRVLHVNRLGSTLLRVGWQPPGSDAIAVIPDEAFHRE